MLGKLQSNKRVDVIVLSQTPGETRALMGEAYDELRRQAGLEENELPELADNPTDDASGASAAGSHDPGTEELP